MDVDAPADFGLDMEMDFDTVNNFLLDDGGRATSEMSVITASARKREVIVQPVRHQHPVARSLL